MDTRTLPIEPLESRIAPAIFIVTSTADSGASTLRRAILDANANSDSDTIHFDLPGSGVRTIAPITPLPQITAQLTIDGTTQSGYTTTPLIELSGVSAGAGANGLDFRGSSSGVTGLSIARFGGAGVVLGGAGEFVTACFVGTTSDGAGAAGNATGISVTSIGATIQSDVISGNTGPGIHLTSTASDATVTRDNVGSNFALTAPLPNGIGIRIDAGAVTNTIGGTTLTDANTIAGNTGAGVAMLAAGAGNRVSLNRIFSNGGLGIDLFNDGVTANGGAAHLNFPVINEVFSSASGTIVRGQFTGAPSTQYQLHFFSGFEKDASGFGEGRDFFGFTNVTTNTHGDAGFDLTYQAQVTVDAFVTGLALDASGNSEFSAAQRVVSGVVALKFTPDQRAVTFKDADGDAVTVRVSKGQLADVNLSIVPAGTLGGGRLEAIDLTNNAAGFSGTNVTVTAKRAAGGDGLVDVGAILANNFDLGNVAVSGDLGRIEAGESSVTPLAIRSLTVQSMGRLGFINQGNSGSLFSTITGGVGSIVVKDNVDTASLSVSGDLGVLSIGGGLYAGGASNPGIVEIGGVLKKLHVGASIVGSEVATSGSISAVRIVDAAILGSIIGGVGDNSGTLHAGAGGIGKLTVAGRISGDIRNSAGLGNGSIVTTGPLSSLTLGGNLVGGAAGYSGYIEAAGFGTITVKGALVGGGGEFSGSIQSARNVSEDLDGIIRTIRVAGSLIGGTKLRSGSIVANDGIVTAFVAGSLEGGSGSGSGTIEASGAIGSVRIGGSALGANLAGHGLSSGSILCRDRIGSVDIRGDLRSVISTVKTLGSVKIGGEFAGTILARGNLTPTTRAEATAIGSVTVGGDATGAIGAGYDPSLGSWTHSDVIIRAVSIGGDASGLSISAGVSPGPNGKSGDDDDVVAPSASSVSSEITSIVIRGRVLSVAVLNAHDGFTAQKIGALQIGGVKYPLTGGADRFDLGVLGNVSVREV